MEGKLVFLKELTKLVKQKKELSPLDDAFVAQALEAESYSVDPKYDSFEKFTRSKHCKELVSQVRKKLRDVYGLFLLKPLSTREIDALESIDTSSLLEHHKSTQERKDYYASIYPLLFDELTSWGLPQKYTLLDIACGYNPLAYSFLPIAPEHYAARDLSSQDMGVIQHFFDKFGLSGDAQAENALGTSFLQYLEKNTFDLTFLFKALDPFEQIKRHSSKKLLSTLQSSFIVVSFSLFSIGGKTPIPTSKRSWFEKFCTQQNWEYKTLELPNEFFYLIKTNR